MSARALWSSQFRCVNPYLSTRLGNFLKNTSAREFFLGNRCRHAIDALNDVAQMLICANAVRFAPSARVTEVQKGICEFATVASHASAQFIHSHCVVGEACSDSSKQRCEVRISRVLRLDLRLHARYFRFLSFVIFMASLFSGTVEERQIWPRKSTYDKEYANGSESHVLTA
jgi:hypothetical protein